MRLDDLDADLYCLTLNLHHRTKKYQYMRKLKISAKSKNVLSIPNEVVTGPKSIMGAFETVLSAATKSELVDEKLSVAKEAFELLQNKLDITTFQTVVLAMLIDHVSPLQPRQMASFLGTNNIRVMSLLPQVNELVERRLVRSHLDRMEHVQVYEIRKEVLTAYMQDKALVPNSNAHLTLPKLFDRLAELFAQCDNDELEVDELNKEIEDIIAKNPRHEVCKLMRNRDQMEQVLFLFLCTAYVLEGDDNISPMDFRNFFSAIRFRGMCNQLNSGRHPLMEVGLVVHSATETFSGRDGITISEEIRKQLSMELNLEWNQQNNEVDKRGLRLASDIQEKSLFFNEAEQKSVDRLVSLLKEENYQDVRSRLSVFGMRKGFACLLYGAPGTGKTETVLQLAKQTGRDVMAVNISQVKSKWVGDTEKNIKEIFDRYRVYCQKCELAPILLFNEADAIIGRRSDNVQSSVDKMENAMQNIILEEFEKLDGILIATTNLTCNMDPAFERRFIYKIEFQKPEPIVKVNIWQSMLKDLSREDAEVLSGKYDFSGGQIENIVRKQVVDHILYNSPLTLERLDEYCQMEQIHKESRRSVIGFR